MFSLNQVGKYFSNLNLKTLRDRETIDRLKNHKKTAYGSFIQYFSLNVVQYIQGINVRYT